MNFSLLYCIFLLFLFCLFPLASHSQAISTERKPASTRSQSCLELLNELFQSNTHSVTDLLSKIESDSPSYRSLNHFFTWTGKIDDPKIHFIRSLILKKFQSGTSSLELAKRANAYGKVYSNSKISNSPELNELYSILFTNPTFEDHLYSIGEVLGRSGHFHITDAINHILTNLVHVLRKEDSRYRSISNDILHQLYIQVDESYRAVKGEVGLASTPRIDLNRFLLTVDDLLITDESLVQAINKILKDRSLSQKIATYLQVYPSEKGITLIEYLSEQAWFKNQGFNSKANTASYYIYLAHFAEKGDLPSNQSRLLKHTLDHLVRLEIPVYAKKLEDGVGGLAYGREKIELNDGGELTRAIGQNRNALRFQALNVLPHEVHHILSKTYKAGQASSSFNRFIEECRAYQVGFLGANGRKMSQVEFAEIVLYLLGYHQEKNIYPYIEDLWKSAPSKFYPLLKKVGFENPKELVGNQHINVRNLVESHITKEDSFDIEDALDGWKDYLTNAPV